MGNTFRYILALTIGLTAYNLQSQIDDSNNGGKLKGGSLGTFEAPATEVKKPKTLDFNTDNGFKTANQELNKEQERQRKEKELENKGILTQAKINEENSLRAFKGLNGMYHYPVIDQDLGSISTLSKSVNIICRDFKYPDGDRVTIYINEIPVVTNLTLQQNFQSFNIPLQEGINTIKIVALSQGTSGLNTAAFKIYNDAGMVLASKEWLLATGAKATLIVVKNK